MGDSAQTSGKLGGSKDWSGEGGTHSGSQRRPDRRLSLGVSARQALWGWGEHRGKIVAGLEKLIHKVGGKDKDPTQGENKTERGWTSMAVKSYV